MSPSTLPSLSSASRFRSPTSELAFPASIVPSCLKVNVYFWWPICESNWDFQVPVTSAANRESGRAASVRNAIRVFMIRCRLRLRGYFYRADLRVLDFWCEGHLDLAVGHLDRDCLHIGLQRPARLDPYVEVLELLPLHVEGNHPLARPGNAVEGFGEMQLHDILPVGYRPRKGVHAVVFGPIKVGTLGVGNLDVRPLDGLAPLEALVRQPDVPVSVFD